jgi:hypothetical protein
VDRFVWDGSTLTQVENIIRLRSLQTDNIVVPGHPGTNNANELGNHNGGVMRFGPDEKLYMFMGDQGRCGWMQNLPNGPFLTAPFADDTFGGPAPDNVHLSGVTLRLNQDGTAPDDNPFFTVGAALGGEVGANLQKIYSYGHRNGFGMAFDPVSGALWATENADDAFSELNRVISGMNGGWIQLAGPLSRMAQWKSIETTQFNRALQQVRYPPTRAAYTTNLAQSRMLMLPGAVYVDPELSWKYEIGPSGTAFVQGTALGAEYEGTLWFGSSRSFGQVGANGGSLYRIKLTPDRLHVDTSADPRLADRVADNLFRAQVVVVHQPVAVTRAADVPSLLRGHAVALQRWAAAGADLVMGGHIHLPYVMALHGLARPIWAVHAGTAVSSRVRQGVPNSVNLLRWCGFISGLLRYRAMGFLGCRAGICSRKAYRTPAIQGVKL